MEVKVILCALFGVFAWFVGCITVMWWKYHAIKRFMHKSIFLKGKKMLALLLFVVLGALAGATFCLYGWMPTKIVKYLVLMYAVLIIAYIDGQTHLIPNVILAVLFGFRILVLMIEMFVYPTARMELLANAFGGMMLGFLLFFIAYLISRKGIGMGDVKLVAVVGFYTGTTVLYAIMILALVCCVLYSVVQLIRHKVTTKDMVAFGPFVAIGTVLALFLG